MKFKLMLILVLVFSLSIALVASEDFSVKSTVEINDATANGPVLENDDRYGSSIANIGDLNGDGVDDIVVGAYLDDAGRIGGNRGAVHISFMNTDGSIDSTVEINDLTANGPFLGDGDQYGWSVTGLGDLNGDGVNDIAVGTPWDDTGGANMGAVYISFMNTDGSVDSTVKIDDTTANGPVLAGDDGYGYSVANIGDLNGDGVNDIAVGAYWDDAGGANKGAVHISFMNTDGSIDSTVEINDLTANGPVLAEWDDYGYSVANIGDLNGDGVNDIAVGAAGDDTGGANRGAVHISFMNTDGSVDSTVKIDDTTANGPILADNDLYGSSIANLGDLDSDGVDDIAVGAYQDNAGGADRGAVHISFMNTDGSVDSTVKIDDTTANGPVLSNSDYYGYSVANISLNGEGIAVGAIWDSGGGVKRGAVHISYLGIPPVISTPVPTSGTSFPSSTTAVTLGVSTDEAATCRYSTVAGTAYAAMTNTFTGVALVHTAAISTRSGSTYNYYIRCIDAFANADIVDYQITFSIAESSGGGGGDSTGDDTGEDTEDLTEEEIEELSTEEELLVEPVIFGVCSTKRVTTVSGGITIEENESNATWANESEVTIYGGETLNFYFNQEQHKVRILSINGTTAQLEIYSERVVVYVDLNQTKQVDLNNDSINDITITLNSVDLDNNSANFELQEATSEPTEEIEPKSNNITILIASLLAILALVSIGIYLMRRRH